MCKHSDYNSDDAHFFPKACPSHPTQKVSWTSCFLRQITNALKTLAGATAQATASNRSRLSSNTDERALVGAWKSKHQSKCFSKHLKNHPGEKSSEQWWRISSDNTHVVGYNCAGEVHSEGLGILSLNKLACSFLVWNTTKRQCKREEI